MNSWINLTALWKIVVVGLAAGAGLPALFALGLRALNPAQAAAGAGAGAPSGASPAPIGRAGDGMGSGGGSSGGGGSSSVVGANPTASGQAGTSGPLGIAVAGLCFLVILAAIGWGIFSIVHNS